MIRGRSRLIAEARFTEKEVLYKARIKELENIICPFEQHEYVMVDEEMHIIDGLGTVRYDRRYVCKKCLKAAEKLDCV